MVSADKSTTGVPSKIADELRSMIARGTLSPGMRLGQTELASQFNASRVPVREALKLLSSEGIVDHDPNRGFFVTRLSRDEAEQLFALRHLVEDELMRTVEWPSEEQIKELEVSAQRLEELLDKGDRQAWWIEHRQFHTSIFNLSPKKIVMREALRLWALTDRFRALLPLPRRPSEEREVVNKQGVIDALRSKDRAKLIASRRNRREAFECLVLEMLEARGL
jgi:DNA-binding GntR family transcriptional regulator